MPGSILGRLLIVDDEIELLNSLADKLAKQGYETVRFNSPREALIALENQNFDLLLTDLMMPEMDGISLLRAARRIDPQLASIVMTGQATVQTAVDAMKTGALDYVLKPFKLSVILPVLARALELRRLRLENIQLRETVGIYELCNAIAFTLDHQILLNKVIDAALQQCEAEEGSIMLPTEQGDELRVAVIRGEGRAHLVGERVPVGAGVAGWVIRHRESVTLFGEVHDARFTPVKPRNNILCAISMPMLVGGKLIGVLNINATNRRRSFTIGQVKALGILANTGAAALESARLHMAIRRAEEQYRSIFEHASEGILQTTPSGQLLIANPAAARMLGYDSPEDLIAEIRDIGTQMYRTPGERSAVIRLLEKHGSVQDVELQLVRKDGSQIWASLSSQAIRDVDGNTLRYESTVVEITRRKHAERRSAAEHRVAQILASAASWPEALPGVLHAVGEALDWDCCALWWIGNQDAVLSYHKAWHRGTEEAVAFESQCQGMAIARGTGFIGRVWATGEPAWVTEIVEDSNSPRLNLAKRQGYRSALAFPVLLGKDVLCVIDLFSRDVKKLDVSLSATLGAIGSQIGQFIERRRIEEERDRFFNLSVDMLCVVGFDRVFQVVNPAWVTTLGWTIGEFLGHPFTDFVHPDDLAATEAEFDRLVNSGGFSLAFENRYRCKDGSSRWLSWRAVADSARRVVYASARDNTMKRKVDSDLRLRDRAIRAVTQGILITDAGQTDNPIIYATPAFERMTGYEVAEVLGRNCRLLQGVDTDPAAVSRLREAIQVGKPCTLEILNYRKDHAPFWNELSISPVRDEQGVVTHFVGVLTDVTARRKLEEQLRQSQKMDAIGKLAGGIAHDFNNLLTVISGYSELLLDQLPNNDPHREMIAEIHHAGERSAGLTRQLLAFSRQQILAPRILDLTGVVTDTEKMLGRLIGEDIRLSTVLGAGLWAVRADPGQMEQVLLNLAVNARDAMPDGGCLTIEARNVYLDDAYASSHPEAQPGPHVMLAVADTGFGMSPTVMARIFEPFYTTKDPGKGTGLGLATVHGIVKQSGGHIGVYSEVGVGTTFKVYLPRAEGQNSGSHSGSNVPLSAVGTETILLVEDDESVRILGRHILVGAGYTVLEASNGADAVRIVNEYGGTIHLIMTDVVLPGGMGGRHVVVAVRAVRPEIRVLFVSGYTDDAVVRHGVLESGVNFLQKPFTPYTLAGKVRAVLDTNP